MLFHSVKSLLQSQQLIVTMRHTCHPGVSKTLFSTPPPVEFDTHALSKRVSKVLSISLGHQLGRFRHGGAFGHQLGRFRCGGAHGHQLRRFHVQINQNFTSNSISILRPIRPQFYVPPTVLCNTFFLPTVRSWGDMELPLATIRP